MYKNLAAALAAACFFSPAISQAPPGAPLKIGFVYVTPITDAGWVPATTKAATSPASPRAA